VSRPSNLTQGLAWAKPGETVRYTVSVENDTDDSFYNLVLNDLLPSGVSVISTDPEGNIDGHSINWSVDELPPSQANTWRILVRVDDDAAPGDRRIVFTDELSSGGELEWNAIKHTSNVRGEPPLQVY